MYRTKSHKLNTPTGWQTPTGFLKGVCVDSFLWGQINVQTIFSLLVLSANTRGSVSLSQTLQPMNGLNKSSFYTGQSVNELCQRPDLLCYILFAKPFFFSIFSGKKVALPSLCVIFVEQNNISIIEVDVAAEVYTIVSRTKGKKTNS